MKKISILIVDDHPMLREALRGAIEMEDDMEVVAEAGNGPQGVARALALKPDVIVMDLYLPIMDGITAVGEIMAANPAARILAITSSTEDEMVVATVQAGASGYLIKDASRDQFIIALRQVAQGKLFFPPEISEKMARGMRQHSVQEREEVVLTPLTRREQEVLDLLGEGLSNALIAARLHLSESTVRVHIFNLIDKLHLTDRNQAIVYALKQGSNLQYSASKQN
jgi:DNA-binding NarL/FixJ family response regulator